MLGESLLLFVVFINTKKEAVQIMEERELKKLGRGQLLEMLVEQSKQIERLQEELGQAKSKLEDRRIQMEETGSIAEASLKMSGIFEAAQQAADDYIASIKLQHSQLADRMAKKEFEIGELKKDAENKAAAMLKESQDHCDKLREEAASFCSKLKEETTQECEKLKNETMQACDKLAADTTDRCSKLDEETTARCNKLDEETTARCSKLDEETAARCSKLEEETRARCSSLEKDTTSKCEAMMAEAKEKAEAYWSDSKAKLDAFLEQHQGLRQLLSITFDEK